MQYGWQLTPTVAAQLVYDCLQGFGETGSNPVLEVIPSNGPVLEQTHYPDPWLGFGGGPLRAYYHCHPQPTRIAGEHGHFHLFLEAESGCWSHLGALSMDPRGQVRALFSTNRWVTDEYWLAAEVMQALAFPQLQWQQLLPVETWLYAMIHLLRPRLARLWEMRDRYLHGLMDADMDKAMLEDRDHYVLSQIPVDLLSELGSLLSV